jgi:hypothetical protein
VTRSPRRAAAIADNRYAKGVNKAGAQRYVDKATKVGAGRYTTGAANAKGDYQTGVQPFLDTIAAQNLPPRRPKGDPGQHRPRRANRAGTPSEEAARAS